MKKLLLISISLFILLAGCRKEEEDSELYWGEITAMKNGESWQGEIYGVMNNTPPWIGFIADVHNERGFLRERLFIFKIPKTAGTYTLNVTEEKSADTLIGAKYNTVEADGDAGGESWDVIEDGAWNNHVKIEQVSGNEIRGSFQVALLKDTFFALSYSTDPDTIVFTEGRFHTKVKIEN